MTATPTLERLNLDGVPYEMRQAPRWGLWRAEQRDGRLLADAIEHALRVQ